MLYLFLFEILSDPLYIISGSHLDIKDEGVVTQEDIRTKNQYTEILTCTVHEGITELGTSSFRGCSKLSYIILPNSLIKISQYSFWGTCIVNLTIPENVRIIEPGNTFYHIDNFQIFYVDPKNKYFCAYDQCLYSHNQSILISVPNGKKTIKFLENVEEIGVFCFWGSRIDTVYIPGTVKKINTQSFVESNCKKIIFDKGCEIENFPICSFQGTIISSICLPPKLKSISSEAFKESKINSITFMENSTLARLESKCFDSCSNLELVFLPKSISYIDPLSFTGCSKLRKVIVEEGCQNYVTNEASLLFSSGYKELVFAPPEITSISIPDETSSITTGILQKLTKVPLEAVNLSANNPHLVYLNGIIYTTGYKEAVSSIGSIKEALIHSSTTKLCVSLFEGIIGLHSIRFNEGSKCTTIEESVAKGCKGLTVAEFPSTIESFGKKSFTGTGLKSVNIPNSTTYLYNYCFADSINLSSVTFEEGSKLNTLFPGCFRNTSLSHIELPESITSIGYSCFMSTKLTSITIPDNTNNIEYSFLSNSDIEKVIFNENSTLATMETNLFSDCKKLRHVMIPPSVINIQSSCFKDCVNLQTVEFIGISKLESIPSLVFDGCSALVSFDLPASVKSVDASSFFGCLNLVTINPKIGSKYVFEQNGLYCDEKQTLSLFVPGVSNGTILASAKAIGPNAFYGDQNLCSLDFPIGSQLETIGADTFYGCNKLYKLILPSLLVTIHDGCFRNCINLFEWRIRDNSLLKSIGDQAFVGCTSLSIVDFGKNSQLRQIGEKSFFNCQKLKSIIIPSKVSSIGASAFEGCSGLNKINFENISNYIYIEIPNACFSECTGLASIVINERITSIKDKAFFHCYSLSTIEIYEGITSIGEQSFSGCNLKEVELPKTITSLGSQCFFSNDNLIKVTSSAESLSIGEHCFSQCVSLRLAAFCSNTEIVGDKLFENSNLVFIYVISDYPALSISGIPVQKSMTRCLVFPTQEFTIGKSEHTYRVFNFAHVLYEESDGL